MSEQLTRPQYTIDPKAQVSGPSVGLLVTGIIGGIFSLGSLISITTGIMFTSLAGLKNDWFNDIPDNYFDYWDGGFAAGFPFIGVLVSAFIIYAAIKMKDLKQWSLAAAASVLAMIPCISPCCLIGIPIGIWCLIVLNRPEIKDAFN